MQFSNIKNLEWISFIILIGFFCAIIDNYINIHYLHEGYPNNTFLFNPEVMFSDFFSEQSLGKSLAPYNDIENCKAVYFPFAYIIFYFYSFLDSEAYLYSFIIFISFILFFLYKFFNPINLNEYKTIFIITFLSYPILFTIDRGNIESVVFIFIGLFLFYYNRDDKKAIFFLVLAGSMKIYPLIFLSLYMINLKFRNIVYAILGTIFISLISLLVFSDDITQSFEGIKSGQEFFKNFYVFGTGGIAYQNSLWGFLRILSIGLPWLNFNPLEMYIPYLISVLLLYVGLLIYMYNSKLHFWEKITIISFSMVLFPYVSFDYKLIYVIFPMVFFIKDVNQKNNFDIIVSTIFALLLIPKNYIYLFSNVSLSTLINPLLMMLLIFYIISRERNNEKYI